LEKGPVQPEALSELVAAFGQCHQLQTALSQKQTALQEQGIALQAAMQELQLQLLPRPQQQQQPMPLEDSALQMAMQSALQQAVPLQQVGEEEELGSTSPLAIALVAMLVWPAAALLLTVAVLLQPVALLL
jgi:predicted transcriptional regulator